MDDDNNDWIISLTCIILIIASPALLFYAIEPSFNYLDDVMTEQEFDDVGSYYVAVIASLLFGLIIIIITALSTGIVIWVATR